MQRSQLCLGCEGWHCAPLQSLTQTAPLALLRTYLLPPLPITHVCPPHSLPTRSCPPTLPTPPAQMAEQV